MPPTPHRLAGAVLGAVLALAQGGTGRAATFVVDTVADTGPGSLRQAIDDANLAADADVITFAIPAAGVPTIAPATSLPAVATPVTIDGSTQSPAGMVELSAALPTGLAITGASVTVRGLVVNGFTTSAISISGPGGALIEGCRIGTNAAGTAGASPGAVGIAIASSGGNQIGGFTAAARNLISGNGTGISIGGGGALPNVIAGNWIGTDATGNAALANASFGIELTAAVDTMIGGTASGAGNVIAGNAREGILASASVGTVVQANLIGVGADGVTAIPNGRHGIRFLSGTTESLVGGAAPNLIVNNAGAGILLAINGGANNAFQRNVIHDNTQLAIDISGAGVAVNDPLDADAGSNLTQNHPVLDAAFAGGTSIDGVLDSTPGTSFTVELYATGACDPSGHGEARELVGELVVNTDAGGHAAFTAMLSRAIDTSVDSVSALVTDPAGNTSEMSPCAPPPPVSTTTSTTTSTSTSSTTVAPATTTSTTSEPTTTSTSSSTTSTTGEPTTSSTSTSVPTTSSTSSTTTTLEPTTTTSTTGLPTTTSTSTTVSTTSTTSTVPEPTTTSTSSSTTSTTGEPTTTSTSSSTTSTLGEPTTTSTSSSTTSTTGEPTTSSTSTSVPTTSSTSSTTTTLEESTTTSTTLPDPDPTTTSTSSSTTSTTGEPTTSSTSTSVPTTSTSTTTLEETTTSSSTTTSTSSTSSTSTTSTSTSSSTTGASTSTTSTTIPDTGCAPLVEFASLRCRLGALTTRIGGVSELDSMRVRLDRNLGKAHRLLDVAGASCDVAKRGPAKRRLRMMRRRLVRVAKTIRKGGAPTITAPIVQTTQALATDTRAFAAVLSCP